MTQEEKQLLLNDLSARLPYGVFIHYHWSREGSTIDEDRELDFSDVETLKYNIENPQNDWCEISWKPYLRPMSSMTEEEKKVVCSMNMISDTELNDRLNYQRMYLQNYTIETFDYFNEHHFDYRGLIPMGLALAMYKEE